jgi:acyl carrier protein
MFTRAPLLSLLFQEEAGSAQADDGQTSVRQMLLNTDAEARYNLLKGFLAEQVGRIMGYAGDRIDVSESVTNLGMDSLMAVELKNRIEKNVGVVIPMVQLLQGPSIAELAGSVLAHLADSPGGEMVQAQAAEDWEEGEL